MSSEVVVETPSDDQRGVEAAAAAAAVTSTTAPFVRESRSVKIPHHRFPPLKKVWMEVYTPIVEQCKLEIRMNLKSRSVDLRTSPATSTADGDNSVAAGKVLLQKAEDFVKAVIAGFDVRDAVALLRMDDVYIEGFEIKDVRANLQGDNLSRCIGRISGSHGKTKYTIENVTRTRLVVADTKIWIMGTTQNIRVARDAICDLIRGSPAAKVYTRIRAVMNRVSNAY
ncbi:Pre-rRNA-processing protein PNO1 [Novymonas esmeraldas]|uniref:Pre-rRNA-processing protein PNO1 n=1 Tax=Novymonas esmeraldas TaxID=1808958 RepID=A0AAW0F7B8_9TRYP